MDESDLGALIAELAPRYLQPDVIEQFVGLVDDEIAAQVPQVAADSALRRDVDASTRSQLLMITAAVVGGSAEINPPPESLALARTVARRGMDLRVLLRIYGVGRQAALRYVNETIDELSVGPEAKRAVLVRVWGATMHWLEGITDVLVTTYAQEHEDLARGVLARRNETVHALLAGQSIPADEAARILDHPMRRHQTAFVFWTDDTDPAPDVLTRLDGFARACATELDAAHLLTVQSGARELWAWAAHTHSPYPASLSVPVDRHAGLRGSVGMSGYGLPGFVRSHREAVAAQRIATSTPGDATITAYDRVEVPSLVSADLDALRALVARELRGLASADAVTARLRETLRTYYRCSSRSAATAQALGLHKNTIRYRLDQARDLLRHDVDERRLQVEIALVAVETYGEALLPDGRA